MKTCGKCGQSKPETDFYKRRDTKDGLQVCCKQCARDYRETHTVKESNRLSDHKRHKTPKGLVERRDQYLWRRYALTYEKEQAMLEEQGYKCAICDTDVSAKRHRVDHCHTTKLVRGILCDGCNVGLGRFKDNPETLMAAADYILRFRAYIPFGE
ncbi:endonuclease VII domain-containing protein [Thiothrix sp.]|uniref:endonuclease VII domain-containing protein n=1 Tax=Thiothrix sp. TaxID=1032 RepID=UPI003423AFAD